MLGHFGPKWVIGEAGSRPRRVPDGSHCAEPEAPGVPGDAHALGASMMETKPEALPISLLIAAPPAQKLKSEFLPSFSTASTRSGHLKRH
jgi:hypothetical protein